VRRILSGGGEARRKARFARLKARQRRSLIAARYPSDRPSEKLGACDQARRSCDLPCGPDPRTPWYAKALAVCVAGFALSALDLIPDFVPVIGYLDDVLIVPLGILAVLKLIPSEVMADSRAAAAIARRNPQVVQQRS
jgi:uncharacterized membrane protein YkvA (DUF1232 family)